MKTKIQIAEEHRLWREQQARDVETAKAALAAEFELQRDAKFDRAWDIAWEAGHACGIEEVKHCFRELADLLKQETKKIQFVHDTDPATEEQIGQYAHCAKCVAEKPGNQSPREWARLNVGWTSDGFQVVCVRHDCNVTKVKAQVAP